MYLRKDIVELARKWIGRKEKDGTHKQIIDIYNSQCVLPRGYKVKYTDEWCATFVSALSINLNYTKIIPPECSCSQMISLLKNLGSWVEDDSYEPKPGDLMFYDWQDTGRGDNTGAPDHVGLVEKVENGKITIIEGNKSEAVARRKIDINGRYIRGYGVPKYDTYVNNQEPAEWAANAWNKAKVNKLIDGTRPYDNMSRQEVITVLDRLGLLD